MAKTQKNAPTKPKSADHSERRRVTKRFNTRFLVIVFGLFAAFVPAVYFVHAWQIDGNADKLKERAEAAEAESDYSQALQLYGQYLNFRENDFDTQLHSLRLRDGLATTGEGLMRVLLGYQELLIRSPDRPDEAEIRQDIIALAMLLDDHHLALQQLQMLLDDPKFEEFRTQNPQELTELKYLAGRSRQANGEMEKAFEAYLEVLEANPKEYKYYVPLAGLFANQWRNLPRKPQPKEAEPEPPPPTTLVEKIRDLLPEEYARDYESSQNANQILDWMVENADLKAEAYLARARFAVGENRPDDARTDVEKARSIETDDLSLLAFSAELAAMQAVNARYRERDRYFSLIQQAREDIARGRKHYPDDPRFPRLHATIEEEALKGIHLLPAMAEKPETKPPFENPVYEAQWSAHQKITRILKEGIDLAEKSLKKLETQKPLRNSERNQVKNPPLTQLQLTGIVSELRWLLADNLISTHEILAADPGTKDTKAASTDSLKTAVNKLVEELERERVTVGRLDFLKARLLIAESDWKEASWTLEQARLRFTGQRAMIQRVDTLLNQCYGRMGNPDEQLQVVQRALREKTGWLTALDMLPKLYEEANRIDDALNAVENIKGFPGAALMLARLRMKKQLNYPATSRRWDSIYQALDQAENSSVDDPVEVAVLKSRVLALEADQLAGQGEQAQSKDKYDEAVKALDSAIDEFPKNAELRAARALFELRRPDGGTAEERLKTAAAMVEKSLLELTEEETLPLRLAAVQLASLLPTADAVRELAALEKLEEPAIQPEDRWKFLAGLAQAHLRVAARATDSKDQEAAEQKALDCQSRAAALESDLVPMQIALAELAFRQKDASAIQQAIDRVEAIEGPMGPNGNCLKALKLIAESKFLNGEAGTEPSPEDEKTAQTIRTLLREAMKERPYWPTLSLMLGDLEWRMGNNETAITHYEEAFKHGHRSRSMILRMVEHYKDQGKLEYASEFLRTVSIDAPVLLTSDLIREHLELSVRLGRIDEAAGLARDYAAGSNDYRVHLWESERRRARGEQGDAVLAPLLRARDLAKDQPAPWIALVNYYARTGKLDEAKATIAETKAALAAQPGHLQMLTLAQCYEIVGDREQAEQHYQRSYTAAKVAGSEAVASAQLQLALFYLRSKSTDADQRKAWLETANKHLDQLLDPKREVPESVYERARLQKAQIIAAAGSYNDVEKALEFLEESRRTEEPSNEALRTRYRLHQIRGRYRDRQELVRILEKLDSRSELSLDERFFLARAYESTNQWPKAQEQFQELLNRVPLRQESARAKLLADYALALLGREDVDKSNMLSEGEKLVKELERLEPNSFRAATARALLLHRQDKGEEAAELLKDYIAKLNFQTPEQVFRDLVEQQKIDEALDSLQKLLDEQSAKKIIDHVRKLVAEDKQDEAVAVLKRYIAASDLVANVQTALVRVIARFLEQIDQFAAAEETYREYARRSKQPEAILEVAAFLARRNRVDEALTICESAWEKCDPRVVARVSVGTLRTTGKPSAAQIERVETRLVDAMENATTEHWTQLITSYADLRDLQGKYDDSINVYREMLKRNPQNVTALNNLAWLLSYRSGAHAEAQELIDQAVRLYGPAGALIDTRGMISLRRGQTSKALKDLKQAAEEIPAAAIYFHLAQAHLANGDKAAAEAAFRDAQAKDLDPVTDLHVLEVQDYQRLADMFK